MAGSETMLGIRNIVFVIVFNDLNIICSINVLQMYVMDTGR